MRAKPPIYIFSPKITYKRFNAIWKKFPDTTGGPIPKAMTDGRLCWQMVRDRQLIIYIDPLEVGDEIIFATKLPKKRELMELI